jgi:hypothetical protein
MITSSSRVHELDAGQQACAVQLDQSRSCTWLPVHTQMSGMHSWAGALAGAEHAAMMAARLGAVSCTRQRLEHEHQRQPLTASCSAE